MNHPKAVQANRWFNAWRSSERPTAGIDAADMGTAFGLEMSLLDPTPARTAPAESRTGWIRRLSLRRRSAP